MWFQISEMKSIFYETNLRFSRIQRVNRKPDLMYVVHKIMLLFVSYPTSQKLYISSFAILKTNVDLTIDILCLSIFATGARILTYPKCFGDFEYAGTKSMFRWKFERLF